MLETLTREPLSLKPSKHSRLFKRSFCWDLQRQEWGFTQSSMMLQSMSVGMEVNKPFIWPIC
jgi:hypothetical protein